MFSTSVEIFLLHIEIQIISNFVVFGLIVLVLWAKLLKINWWHLYICTWKDSDLWLASEMKFFYCTFPVTTIFLDLWFQSRRDIWTKNILLLLKVFMFCFVLLIRFEVKVEVVGGWMNNNFLPYIPQFPFVIVASIINFPPPHQCLLWSLV